MFKRIIHIPEPELVFGNDQTTIDPRDGLILFGPNENWDNSLDSSSYSISAAVIGTRNAHDNYKKFVCELKKPIISIKRNIRGDLVSNELQRPSFPGFEAVFNIHWPERPDIFIEITYIEIENIFKSIRSRKARTSKIVDLYLNKMIEASKSEDQRPNIWFVLVPKKIYDNCRSKKGSGLDFSPETIKFYKEKELGQTSLFTDDEMFGGDLSDYFSTSSDFHHLLKARANQLLLDPPIQIIVEPKLQFRDISTMKTYTDDMKAFLAWSISTTLYYKLGKKPWKLAAIRPGVCYLGLVFKKLQSVDNNQMVCSAAQLFLNDGDGTIFRGNNGLWMSDKPNEFHLDEKESYKLMSLALKDYYQNNNKKYPVELFIHGRTQFGDKEWTGFQQAVRKISPSTKLVGVTIKDKSQLKFFRDVEEEKGNFGVLRGIAAVINESEAFLFTRGFVPRMNSSTSLEIPNSLFIKVTRGEANIETVLKDIMALTKLNYNTCIIGDGKPVTLRFSDTIGSILTATEYWKEERRQFIYYI